MNTLRLSFVLIAACLLSSKTFALNTIFTYQGRLADGASAATGTYDLRFTLHDALTGGSPVGTLTNVATSISNGLFTVSLDFGAAAFNGSDRWLEIAARTNGAGSFAIVSPRQAITATPYAIFAHAVAASGISGALTNAIVLSNAANSFTGNGSGLVNLNPTNLSSGTANINISGNAATLGGLNSGSFWQLAGNAASSGQFIGTLNNQPLELRANNQTASRLIATTTDSTHSNIVNVVNGSAANFVTAGIYGATIGGGGAGNYLGVLSSNRVTASFGTVSGGRGNSSGDACVVAGGEANSVIGSYSSGGGGFSNQVNGYYGVIAGGTQNTNVGDFSTIAGGQRNLITNSSSGTISGGANNVATDFYPAIGGGFQNRATSTAATIPGGAFNVASGLYSFAAGVGAHAVHDGSFVWAGGNSSGSPTTTADNQFLIYADGGVGIGTTTPGTSLEVRGGIRARGGVPGAFGANNNGYAFNGNNGDTDSGMFSSANGRVEFYADAAERMRITATGVGIGGTNAQTPLHVTPTAAGNAVTIGIDATAGGYTAMQLEVSSLTNGYARIQAIKQSGTSYGNLVLNPFAGNVGIANSSPSNLLVVGGSGSPAYCNGTTWVNGSDRNSKENFSAIDAAEILAKVLALPVQSWNYKVQPGDKHIGPMAQDFHSAFGLNGSDDKHIATVDEAGVALAAIQGLNQKLEQARAENAELKQRLEKLERLLQSH